MEVVRTVAEVRGLVAARRHRGDRLGLVPTMGALHEGHLSLVRRARSLCDTVVVSVFVNPSQFNDPADLAAYPRDEDRDLALAAQAGADVVFTPTVGEIYPAGFATTIRIRGAITETLEGASRGRAHFDGVATVVTKLFAIVDPDVAFFGQKDAQQCTVVRRLVTDLSLPVHIEVCPTVRETDGLAMSSRNVHLHGEDRIRALALQQGLQAAGAAVEAGERTATEVVLAGVRAIAAQGVVPEYLAVVDPDTFAPVEKIDDTALVVVAARVGPVRLIDNRVVVVEGGRVP